MSEEKPVLRRVKGSAQLKWDTKPRRAPNARDIEFQTAELVVSNPALDGGQISLASLFGDGSGQITNRLIWGDCLLACQALLAQGYESKVHLIYIDPPFKSDEDYSHLVYLTPEHSARRVPSMLERLAYRDMWIGGIDSYLDMLYPRLQLMRRLLADTGSIYVHVGTSVAAYVRILLDEIFGSDRFLNEIIWQRTGAHSDSDRYGQINDSILFYAKTDSYRWNVQYTPYEDEYIRERFRSVEEGTGRRYWLNTLTAPAHGRPAKPAKFFGVARTPPPGTMWRFTQDKITELEKQGRIVATASGMPYVKQYLDESPGRPLQSIWSDVQMSKSGAERTGYATQKPEVLLDRIIRASSNPGDLVADFFVGSGTTAVVAEKLGRRWLAVDFGKTGIQVARTRLVEGGAKPFLIENLGNYQREMIYLLGSKIGDVQRVILKLYGAEPRTDSSDLGVRRTDDAKHELIYVGYPDRPVTARKAEELLRVAERLDGQGYPRVVVLGWDYAFNYTADIEARLRAASPAFRVELQSRVIPSYIYDYLKQMRDETEVESLRAKVQFFERPYLKVRAVRVDDGHVEVRIERYVIFDVPVDSADERAEILETSKDNFAFLIDYWAVDNSYDGEVFRSKWQAFRGNGRKPKVVPTVTALPATDVKRVAVRLVDIFGNDASAVVEVAASISPKERRVAAHA